jgi:thiol-disulfide isomerase/thioredoxin
MFKRSLLLAIIGSAIALTACSKEHKLDPQVQNAPQAAGKLLAGQGFNLIDNKDKVTVVQFWATWCPVCIDEMPMVQTWYDTNKGKGLNMVAISIDDNKSEVTDWLAKNAKYTLPYAWHKEFQHNFGKVKGTPTFLVVGKDGTVVKSYVGGIKQADLDEISKLL